MEIAGNSTFLVKNLLVEVVGLLLRLVATIDDRLYYGEIDFPDNRPQTVNAAEFSAKLCIFYLATYFNIYKEPVL